MRSRGNTAARRIVDLKPLRVQHLADHHLPDSDDHAKHLKRVFAAQRFGFNAFPDFPRDSRS